ncbi:MAG: hypothetical protein SVG88_15050 [Halobacteriales archaeon]|nr:hypothetical protein [Halobacteriales archaeon]
MTPDTQPATDRLPSIGIDAAPLDRYTAITLNERELIVFDERNQDAWIRSSAWTDIETMQ